GLRADLKDYEEGKEGGEAGAEVNGEVERLREELRKLQQQHDELWTHLNEALEDKWNTEEKLQGLRAQVRQLSVGWRKLLSFHREGRGS
ncbi:hypothetical protein FOZ62_014374, partial [Perkinsus olseni]